MSRVKQVLAGAARMIRWAAREVAETIRWGAEPNAVARSLDRGGSDSMPPSIGGAMIAGAGRRIGTESNRGAVIEQPED
jgi:hypothetical protein